MAAIDEQSLSLDSIKAEPVKKVSAFWLWAGGVGFTLIIAWFGLGLAKLPGLDRVGPLACAIILAVMYRQIWGYPVAIRSGIVFSSKRLLRFAIVLFGLKLNIEVLLHQGFGLLLRDVITIALAIGLTMLFAKWLKAEFSLSLLLGVGAGVCGAAAIAAVSPIIRAKDEDTAMGVGIIALVGTIFAIVYTILLPYLALTIEQYGTWAGISLHEIAHVALAAAPAGQDALAIALLAKLGRVFLLIPLCFILMYGVRFRQRNAISTNESKGEARVEFPWFLIGFVGMSVLGSYVFGKVIEVPEWLLANISFATTFILAMAMTGLGLNVSLRDLHAKAWRPLIAMSMASVILAVVTFLML